VRGERLCGKGGASTNHSKKWTMKRLGIRRGAKFELVKSNLEDVRKRLLEEIDKLISEQ